MLNVCCHHKYIACVLWYDLCNSPDCSKIANPCSINVLWHLIWFSLQYTCQKWSFAATFFWLKLLLLLGGKYVWSSGKVIFFWQNHNYVVSGTEIVWKKYIIICITHNHFAQVSYCIHNEWGICSNGNPTHSKH